MERLNPLLRMLYNDAMSDEEEEIPQIPRTLQIIGYLHDHLNRITGGRELEMVSSELTESQVLWILNQSTIPLTTDMMEGMEDPQCPVCLVNEGEAKDGLYCLIEKCGHMFHSACLSDWIKQKRSCPMCRENL